MEKFNNLMEVLKILPKTNCRQCNAKTCMAFAADVMGGKKALCLCPHVPPEIAGRYADPQQPVNNMQQEMDRAMKALRAKLKDVDLAAAAERTGGHFNGKRLTLKVMGKDFSVDSEGTLYTDIHTNIWVTAPIIRYIIHCKGTPVSRQWVSMRELPNGKDWHHFFNHQCEQRMKKLADDYTELFEDLVHLFDGKPVADHYESDIAVMLRPLPLVPVLVSYLRPDEGMDSNLSLLFDATAEDNLGSEWLYRLVAGTVRMFEKLALRHGA